MHRNKSHLAVERLALTCDLFFKLFASCGFAKNTPCLQTKSTSPSWKISLYKNLVIKKERGEKSLE
jgi:hypothetical protein